MSYTPTASNYHWAAVDTTIDPSVGTATDLDGGGQTDHFLSFSVPFNNVVTLLATRGIIGIDQNSTFNYVMATATQAISLNQDLNGPDKTYDGSATWSTLGAQTDPMTASGMVVPEVDPAVGVALLAALATAAHHLKRRSPRRS